MPLKILCDWYASCSKAFIPDSTQHLSNLLGKLLKPQDQLQKSLMYCDFTISSSYPIYALGPSLAGILFETTSIHDIRQQALHIAEAIKGDKQIY